MTVARWWRRRSCPPGWVLGQAASQGASDTLAAHVKDCPGCTADLRNLVHVTQRARALKTAQMPAPSRKRILSALRMEAAGPRRRPTLRRGTSPRVIAAVAGVVLLGAGTLVLALGYRGRALPDPSTARRPVSRPVSRAAIVARGSAAYHRAGDITDEVIHLDDGTVELSVAPLDRGERLRVLTADAEVEVRGTQFAVTASGGRLQAVRVLHGMVEVRTDGLGVSLLTDGDQWLAATASTTTTAAPAAGGAASPRAVAAAPRLALKMAAGPRRGARNPAAVATASPAAAAANPAASRQRHAAFEHGWQLLRSGDLTGAARSFAALEQGAPGDAIVEDAMFWRGVALGRAGEKLQARTVLGAFVVRFPGSPRAPEACVLLGWMLADAGDRPGARALFERAARDRSENVRASARSGLQQLEALDDRPDAPPAPPPTR